MNYTFIFLLLTLISTGLFVFYAKDANIDKGSSLKNKNAFLILLILAALVFNFGPAYYTFLNPEIKTFRPMFEQFDWDMGTTALGWILYEIKNVHFLHDSWWFIAYALDFIKAQPDSLLYQEVFFNQHLKFQYPTTSLLAFDFIKSNTVLEWRTLFDVFNYLSIISLPLLGWFSYKLFYREDVQKLHIERLDDFNKFLPILLMLMILMLFYPIIVSVYLGQIQTAIVVLVAWALYSFSQGKNLLTGVLLGLCAIIKPQWLLIFIWAALRKQWNMLFSGVITMLIFVILAIYFYGINNFLDYANTLSYLSEHGESYYNNQSINGFMHRLLQNGIIETFMIKEFPPYHPVVYFTTLISSVIILGVALFNRIKVAPTEVDLAFVILALTMASPIAWNHHYGVLLPIFAISFSLALKQQTFGKWTIAYLLATWVLSSQNFEIFTHSLSYTIWNPLQSVMLLGIFMSFYLLIRIQNTSRT